MHLGKMFSDTQMSYLKRNIEEQLTFFYTVMGGGSYAF